MSETDVLNEIAVATDTQNRMLAEFILSGRKVTAPIAMRKMGIGHLPRRILDLKEFHALPIVGQWTKYTRMFDGKVTRVKEYWIPINELETVLKTFNINTAFLKDEKGHFVRNKTF